MKDRRLIELISEGKDFRRRDNGVYVSVVPIEHPKLMSFSESSLPLEYLVSKQKEFKEMRRYCHRDVVADLERIRKNGGVVSIGRESNYDGSAFWDILIEKRLRDDKIRKTAPENSNAFVLGEDIITRDYCMHPRCYFKCIQYYNIKIQRGGL